jgi:DNA replication and repair protein RecF
MWVESLWLRCYRNYAEQSVTFHPGVNVLIGENAQGKTNALEAIHLLAVGKSHRTHRDMDLVQHGAQRASVKAVIHASSRKHTLELQLGAGGRRALVGGVQQAKMTDFLGHFQAVLFAPEDLQLVKGGPAVRRRFLDMELSQTQPAYLYHLTQYNRALQQRNTLLRQEEADDAFLDAFEAQLAEHGAQVLRRRLRFVAEMAPIADEIYRTIAENREGLRMEYACTVPEVPAHAGAATDSEAALVQLTEVLLRALQQKRSHDRRFGATSVGPHRDDLRLYLDGVPVQAFASQGQQRTIALSLRLAEIEFIHRQVGEYPVLLLDDVLSELDDSRQRNLVMAMSEKVQTILTTTSLFPLTGRLRENARLFSVCSGIIQAEG